MNHKNPKFSSKIQANNRIKSIANSSNSSFPLRKVNNSKAAVGIINLSSIIITTTNSTSSIKDLTAGHLAHLEVISIREDHLVHPSRDLENSDPPHLEEDHKFLDRTIAVHQDTLVGAIISRYHLPIWAEVRVVAIMVSQFLSRCHNITHNKWYMEEVAHLWAWAE